MTDAGTAGGRLRTGFTRATVVALFGLAVLAGFCAWLATAPPRWWSPVTVDAAASDRAAAFEQAVVAEFTRVRPQEPEWAIRIRESDVNAWLSTRLPQWLASRELPDSGLAQASMTTGSLRLGVQRGPVVVWGSASPAAASGGGFRLDSAWSGVGRLPVPIASPQLAGLLQAGPDRPIPLPDGRSVRVLDVEVLPGEIRLRLRTEGR
jgi:hypothetical protein